MKIHYQGDQATPLPTNLTQLSEMPESDPERELYDAFGEHLKVAGYQGQEKDARVAGQDAERDPSYFNY